MEKIPQWKPRLGDDLPWVTERYESIPAGFRFDDLDWSRLGTLEETWRPVLVPFLNEHYANWELNAQDITLAQWFKELQNTLDAKVDNLRKLLEVYEDDIMKPILGRDITRTVTGSRSGTANIGEQSSQALNDEVDKHYDLPVDNAGAQAYETSRDVRTPSGVKTSARADSSSEAENRTENEHWSDVGVRPNYETVEGFWQRNPTAHELAADIFRDCFIM